MGSLTKRPCRHLCVPKTLSGHVERIIGVALICFVLAVLASPFKSKSRLEAENAKSEGRFGKQDFVYMPDEDVYRCPAGEKLRFHYANEEHGQKMRRYWTNACKTCAIKEQCTTGKERRITRWEHEHVLETVQQRLDQDPQAMRRRRETVEHPFGTLKMRMGATHFLMKTLPKVASEMALSVLAYNLTRVMNIVGTTALLAAIRA